MNVIRAKTAGFCMGVALALQKLDKAIDEHSSPDMHGERTRILTLGPIIHNPQVLEAYALRGVRKVNSPQETDSGQCVLIRAHGVPRQDEAYLHSRGAEVVDATCPKVKKAQLTIAKATSDDRTLLLFGEADHPEVRGLVSYAAHEAHIFDSMEQLRALPLDARGRYVLASQTTQDRRVFDTVEAYLRQRLASLPVLSTICDATRHRQDEAMALAAQVDCMVVVGGKNSGNTRRLADVAAAQGVPTWHVESEKELDPKNFSPKAVAGLTAGASTPKSLIDSVQRFLEEIA